MASGLGLPMLALLIGDLGQSFMNLTNVLLNTTGKILQVLIYIILNFY